MSDVIQEWNDAYAIVFTGCELPHTFAISPIRETTRAVTIEVKSKQLERRANWTMSLEMFKDSIPSVRVGYLRNLRKELERNK